MIHRAVVMRQHRGVGCRAILRIEREAGGVNLACRSVEAAVDPRRAHIAVRRRHTSNAALFIPDGLVAGNAASRRKHRAGVGFGFGSHCPSGTGSEGTSCHSDKEQLRGQPRRYDATTTIGGGAGGGGGDGGGGGLGGGGFPRQHCPCFQVGPAEDVHMHASHGPASEKPEGHVQYGDGEQFSGLVSSGRHEVRP
eukprot:scaffold36317_cov177-Isochrysis_galbana.AAC.1